MTKVLDQSIGEDFALYHGDCVEVIKGIPDESIHFSIYSPPFESLFTYSNSDRDMGNSSSTEEFWDHYQYLIKEQYRTMMSGRIVAVHCMNLPTTKGRDGFIGIRDFRGEIIRAFQKEGFIFHSEVVIWKDPVVAMQRTKALGLLHKTIEKDSSKSRMGIPDTMVIFRKPGDNPIPVSGRFDIDKYAGEDKPEVAADAFNGEVERWNSINIWQRYADPIWADIRQNYTLNYRAGRDKEDERHICPLQLDVIDRCLQLWSLPGETVLTPFLGVGSEAYAAVKHGRKAIGIELKESYFTQAVKNVEQAVIERDSPDLFGDVK